MGQRRLETINRKSSSTQFTSTFLSLPQTWPVFLNICFIIKMLKPTLFKFTGIHYFNVSVTKLPMANILLIGIIQLSSWTASWTLKQIPADRNVKRFLGLAKSEKGTRDGVCTPWQKTTPSVPRPLIRSQCMGLLGLCRDDPISTQMGKLDLQGHPNKWRINQPWDMTLTSLLFWISWLLVDKILTHYRHKWGKHHATS